jgi:hypothetical protein
MHFNCRVALQEKLWLAGCHFWLVIWLFAFGVLDNGIDIIGIDIIRIAFFFFLFVQKIS